MDNSPDTEPPVLDSESEGRDDAESRDLRDVLRHLVVVEGDRGDVSLSAVAEAAAGTDRFVPELLSALDDDSTAVRVGAAWTLCALADDRPEAVEYLATRLAGRVDDGPFEVDQTFAYLKGRYPGRVADAVDVATGKRVETDGGVPAGTVADLGDGRQVVRPNRDRRPSASGRPAGPDASGRSSGPTGPRRPSSPADPPRNHPTHPDFESADADAADTERVDPTGSEAAPDTFAAIASLSSLDRLSAVDTGVEKRYAEGYRCRADRDGTECGVAVRLFDRPDENDRLAFRGALEDCLARWGALGELDGVVEVAEWGLRPRPWVRTAAVDASLAERGSPDPACAVDQAVELAEAVATLHSRGAVHAGLDPKNVVYPCGIESLNRPLVDNVGLMSAFREYFEPANYLDPRFAPPEYYDDEFGTVDAATDVYGLGAVVYYLVTGRPPFVGSYCDVRRGILTEQPPAPSDVAGGVPPRLDAVLGKALAKQKLTRYDGVEPFLRDLERVQGGCP